MFPAQISAPKWQIPHHGIQNVIWASSNFNSYGIPRQSFQRKTIVSKTDDLFRLRPAWLSDIPGSGGIIPGGLEQARQQRQRQQEQQQQHRQQQKSKDQKQEPTATVKSTNNLER